MTELRALHDETHIKAQEQRYAALQAGQERAAALQKHMQVGTVYNGAAIRERRQKDGLDIGDVAGLLGMSTSQISRLERGESLPPFLTLVAVTYILGVDLGDLVRLPAA